LAGKLELSKLGYVTFGGIVTNVREVMTKKEVPMGIVTIEDFYGSGEVLLFGTEWTTWKSLLYPGYAVYVRAKSVRRFQLRGEPTKPEEDRDYDLRLQVVEFMQDVKDNMVNDITINVNLPMLDDTIVTELKSVIEQNPGKTKVKIRVKDAESKTHFTMKSKTARVDLGRKLLTFINDCDALDYSIN